MERHVKNSVVLVEDLLCAISVVDVPVKDENLLQVVGFPHRFVRNDSHIVEEAEASRNVMRGVMTWWSDVCKAILEPPI